MSLSRCSFSCGRAARVGGTSCFGTVAWKPGVVGWIHHRGILRQVGPQHARVRVYPAQLYYSFAPCTLEPIHSVVGYSTVLQSMPDKALFAINKPIIQSINQANKQARSPPINRSINQSVNQPISQAAAQIAVCVCSATTTAQRKLGRDQDKH